MIDPYIIFRWKNLSGGLCAALEERYTKGLLVKGKAQREVILDYEVDFDKMFFTKPEKVNLNLQEILILWYNFFTLVFDAKELYLMMYELKFVCVFCVCVWISEHLLFSKLCSYS